MRILQYSWDKRQIPRRSVGTSDKFVLLIQPVLQEDNILYLKGFM